MATFQKLDRFAFRSLMASSEVDQKYLGRYAKQIDRYNREVAQGLFQVLGLSVLLSKKLIRARRLRRLDTTRDTKSLQLYHHIIFLAREGLILLEQYILPEVDDPRSRYPWEIRVLVNKLRASFYHIFVLFHNQPSIHVAAIPAFQRDRISNGKKSDRSSVRRSPPMMNGRPIGDPGPMPPGLTPVSVPKPSATFLLPARNYIPDASSYFSYASEIADAHLFGSHPIRLSVKTEYSAYLYDCLHDGEASRKLAQAAIKDVYNASETIDDEMFEDSAEMVVILGKMMKRGLNNPGTGSGSTGSKSTLTTPGSTPRPQSTTRPTSTSRPPSESTPRPTAKNGRSPPKPVERRRSSPRPVRSRRSSPKREEARRSPPTPERMRRSSPTIEEYTGSPRTERMRRSSPRRDERKRSPPTPERRRSPPRREEIRSSPRTVERSRRSSPKPERSRRSPPGTEELKRSPPQREEIISSPRMREGNKRSPPTPEPTVRDSPVSPPSSERRRRRRTGSTR